MDGWMDDGFLWLNLDESGFWMDVYYCLLVRILFLGCYN